MDKVDEGDRLWAEAQALHLDNKFAEAEKIYVGLLEQNHDNRGLMASLGSMYIQTGRYGLAIHFLEAAIKGGLKQSDCYSNLGLAYRHAGQIDKARENLEIAVKTDPTPETLTMYSGLFVESGEDEKCIDLCEKAIAENPELSIAHWNLAIALLAEGKWDRAWDEHDWGLKKNGMRENRIILDVPIWDGPVKSPGKTVLIYGEQGLGDEIMFSSMLADLLKTNDVVFECHQRLATLFKKSFPGMPIYGTREDRAVDWAYNHKVDYRIAIGSLGQFYRRSKEAFPGTSYLKADALPKGDKFRVGISWQGGGAKLGRVQKRSVPLSWWKPILNVPGVEFVSLQYTEDKNEIELVNALGYDVKRMEESKAHDYYETARLVKSCDLVISVCTSIVHLAGSLGVPCWVITPKFPAWRYQNSGRMPWYQSVRLYRSTDVEQWAWRPIVALIGDDLDELVNAKLQRTA